jgi:hypothetical protein
VVIRFERFTYFKPPALPEVTDSTTLFGPTPAYIRMVPPLTCHARVFYLPCSKTRFASNTADIAVGHPE